MACLMSLPLGGAYQLLNELHYQFRCCAAAPVVIRVMWNWTCDIASHQRPLSEKMMLVGWWITFTQDSASHRTIPLILTKASTGRSNFFLIWFGNASRIPNLRSKNPACQDSPLQTPNTHISSSTKHAKLNACCTPLECNPCDMKLSTWYYIMSKTLIWKNKVNRMMDHFCLWSPYHICLIPWSWPKSCQAGPIFLWSEL